MDWCGVVGVVLAVAASGWLLVSTLRRPQDAPPERAAPAFGALEPLAAGLDWPDRLDILERHVRQVEERLERVTSYLEDQHERLRRDFEQAQARRHREAERARFRDRWSAVMVIVATVLQFAPC